ncbi:MAG: hypothetical protein IPF61_12305 [Xanthomonadales bacterium]|nr:hypothetical protein [Xanthomonadales bacterium]
MGMPLRRRTSPISALERGGLTRPSAQQNKSRIRARVEHVFRGREALWGFSKVRYRGLVKNANRSFVMILGSQPVPGAPEIGGVMLIGHPMDAIRKISGVGRRIDQN